MPKKKSSSSNTSSINNLSNLKISISAKNQEQKNMLRAVSKNVITFVKDAPGSGKTYLAVGYALQCLLKGEFEKIVFTRPVVEAGGEKLGFLPGNMYEKIDPYMIPIFETLAQLLPADILLKLMPKNGNGNGSSSSGSSSLVRILPLAYMRGISFINSFIICDEMQNATPEQVRMVLTRLGTNSKMILCGDIDQTDISASNGLDDAFNILQNIKDLGFINFTEQAIMRHPIIRSIEERYKNKKTAKMV